MRPVLWGLFVFVICLPMVFVLLIVGAAKYSAMDAFTMTLPTGVRAAVADLTLRNAGYGKDSAMGVDRAIKLDPDSADAWGRRCHLGDDGATGDLPACRRAITLDPSSWNFNGLGSAQEKAKDYCNAEDSYTSAIRASTNDPYSLRNMARAALRCGHTGASVAGFEVAEGLDAKAAADPDEDDDAKDNLLSDRQYLIVVYDRTNQPAKATAICTRLHADWKTCHCELTETGVKCTDAQGTPSSSKK